MDIDTKRRIFDITVWMTGIFAIVLLIADGAAHTMPHVASVDLQVLGAIRAEG